MKTSLVSASTFSVLASTAEARFEFVAMIPNADAFIDVDGSAILSIGHIDSNGGGARNAFGKAFGLVGEYTKEFCEEDSDGDGSPNGVELGDLCCEGPGGANVVTKGISNPADSNETTSLKAKKAGECTITEKSEPEKDSAGSKEGGGNMLMPTLIASVLAGSVALMTVF